MTAIKEMKKEKGKQGVDKVAKRLASIIGNYRKQLMQRGVDVTERVQEATMITLILKLLEFVVYSNLLLVTKKQIRLIVLSLGGVLEARKTHTC